MKLTFIVNERAGGGQGSIIWRQIESQLTLQYDALITKYRGHATEIAQLLAQNTTEDLLLIAVGGDGTIHEVVEGASGYKHITIGAMKAGSGNDFARGFRIFRHVKELEHYILFIQQKNNGLNPHQQLNMREMQKMDIGQISSKQIPERCFVNNAGIGFDAYITTKVNESKLKRVLNSIGLGSLIYTIMTIWSLFTFKRFNVEVTAQGERLQFQNVWFVTMCNQPFFGGGMKISPRSIPNDALLELIVVHNISRLKLLLVFVTVFFGKHERFKEVTCLQGGQFSITTNVPMVTHVDGEFVGYMQESEPVVCKVSERAWYLASTPESLMNSEK